MVRKEAAGRGRSREEVGEGEAAARKVKREFVEVRRGREENGEGGEEEEGGTGREETAGMKTTERRALRSRYLAVKTLISDDKDDIVNVESDKFTTIIGEVESLHKLVQNPREQVADAEALLDIASSLVTSMKSYSNEGITPADFITSLLTNFGEKSPVPSAHDSNISISWEKIGMSVAHIFKSAAGCNTMLGPMSTELKQRKQPAPRKRREATESTRPEELPETETDKRTDTDKNMSTMFEILRKHKSVKFENLILNRNSFAQTVENIFALSFLVKDGRVAITVNQNGDHMIIPRNAPSAEAVASGDVSFSHFVFRYDFKDWKLMAESVAVGDELMPHRTGQSTSGAPHCEQVPESPPPPARTTPIRKFTRNRGLVLQEQTVNDESPEKDGVKKGNSPIRRTRRLFVG